MSKVHVLKGNTSGYTAVIHFPVPAGTNSAGKTWKECVLAAGGAKASSMLVGTGVGQITQTEADQIASGDVIEFSLVIGMKGDGTAPTPQEITSFVDNQITQKTLDYAAQLKYFGYTQN